MATLGAGAGRMMKEVLLTITNRFVCLYDNDEAGGKAIRRDEFFFKKAGCDVEKWGHPEGCKDAGALLDAEFKHDTMLAEFLKLYYSTRWMWMLCQIG